MVALKTALNPCEDAEFWTNCISRPREKDLEKKKAAALAAFLTKYEFRAYAALLL